MATRLRVSMCSLYGAVEVYYAASNIDLYAKYLDWFSPEPGGPRYNFTTNFLS